MKELETAVAGCMMDAGRRSLPAQAIVLARHSGARVAGEAAEVRTSATPIGVAGNPDVFGTIGDSHVGIPGSVPSPAAPVPPRNDSLGREDSA
jgi:hypothetical protein